MWELPSYWNLASNCVILWNSQDNKKKTFWAALLILRKWCSLQVFSFPLALFSPWAPWLLNESLFTEIWLHHPFLPIPFTIYTSLIDFVFTSNFSIHWQKYTSSHAQVLPFICTVCLSSTQLYDLWQWGIFIFLPYLWHVLRIFWIHDLINGFWEVSNCHTCGK